MKKILVICSEAASAATMENTLRTREGVRCTVFHEGMSLLERMINLPPILLIGWWRTGHALF